MFINQGTVSTSKILLVPYQKRHVLIYHEWMKDAEIQETTASEPLTIDEEYSMQSSWRRDHDKLTFIACLPLSGVDKKLDSPLCCLEAGTYDSMTHMLGDVNLFLTPADEDSEGCIGELELMIAPKHFRSQGYGRATILTFLRYIQSHLDEILDEYKRNQERMKLLQLRVKIGSENEKSIKLFESIGFIKVDRSPNYFGEFELVLEGFLGEERTENALKKWGVGSYEELKYLDVEEVVKDDAVR